jgi:predicted enzyme related to lactoylglutathione lyase
MEHTIIHSENSAADVEKLRRFYERLFGWKIEKYPGPMEYWMTHPVPVNNKVILRRSGVNGGFVKK